MRRLLITGNWKMNLTRESCIALAGRLAGEVGPASEIELAVCPPFVYLEAVAAALAGSAVALGAQDLHHEPKGAYTGAISATMLVDLGCRFVILGHSERRHIFGETDEQVNQKIGAALQSELLPIVCVGETLQERESGQTLSVLQRQFDGSLAGLSAGQMGRVVIAYEPVWAIGTGKNATPRQADQVHLDLRRMVETRYNSSIAAEVRIQYGGSVKPDNAAQLLAQENIDGALVGGASLAADDFLAIIAAGLEGKSG